MCILYISAHSWTWLPAYYAYTQKYTSYIYIWQNCTLIKSAFPSIRLWGLVGHQRLRAKSCTVSACVLRGVFWKQQVSPADRIITIFFYVQMTVRTVPYIYFLKKIVLHMYIRHISYLQRVWEFNIFLFVIFSVYLHVQYLYCISLPVRIINSE